MPRAYGRPLVLQDGNVEIQGVSSQLLTHVSGPDLERMAGTTRLELATSAVTVSGIQVLSTTWKRTDGTVSHGKYIIGNAIVYRDVYRGSTTSSASDGVSSQNFSFTAPPSGNTEFDVLASGRRS